jgi:hypothetical protein
MLASYYGRAALAASQVLAGFDLSLFQRQLEDQHVAIGFDDEVCESPAGIALLDMLVRLLARLYPRITFEARGSSYERVANLRTLAKAINPAIGLDDTGKPSVAISIGASAPEMASRTIYAGCTATTAYLSANAPITVERSVSPFGAGAAACLAAANLFRLVFLGESAELDEGAAFRIIDQEAVRESHGMKSVVLVGCGAIGNAFAWALDRTTTGALHLVDPETVELSNLQRYTLTIPEHVGKRKVDVIADAMRSGAQIYRHPDPWEDFVAANGYVWQEVAVAVDSARVRRHVQQSLPRWIANAWTQPGDLGVSTHVFEGQGACLSCLYLPQDQSENEDTIVANQLRIPDQLMKVRELLYSGAGVSAELLSLVAERLGADQAQAMIFVGRSIRELYTEGVCGGALVALGTTGSPRSEVHVPLAHQSALAGLLLAAAVREHQLVQESAMSTIRRTDVMRRLAPQQEPLPAIKDPRGICICQDPVYQKTYRAKYSG